MKDTYQPKQRSTKFLIFWVIYNPITAAIMTEFAILEVEVLPSMEALQTYPLSFQGNLIIESDTCNAFCGWLLWMRDFGNFSFLLMRLKLCPFHCKCFLSYRNICQSTNGIAAPLLKNRCLGMFLCLLILSSYCWDAGIALLYPHSSSLVFLLLYHWFF